GLTVIGVYLTRRWFYGSEGSGIPQVIAAIHAPRGENDQLMQRLFGLRVIAGKVGVSLIGLLGGLTLGREGPTVHIGAAIMAETRRFYPHRSARLERQLLLAVPQRDCRRHSTLRSPEWCLQSKRSPAT